MGPAWYRIRDWIKTRDGFTAQTADRRALPCLYLSGINDSGEMVGAICEPATAQRAVGAHVSDLNSLMPANCSWVLDEATDVNDRGVIVGIGKLNGIYHGFMLVPRV